MARGTHEALPDERNENVFVYINGEFYRREEAKISVFDSGFLVGDGVWEGLRLHDGEFAFLDLHLDRLFEGAKTIGLDIGMTREEITQALRQTVRRNGMEGSSGVHVRLMVTRGDKKTPSQDPRLVVGGPNVSTALMYSFRQRSDTVVVDEPLYGHYLSTTDAGHPGTAEVLEAMDVDGERVVREVILGPCERGVHFFKNMAHHLPGLDPTFLDAITNVLLIRDPAEMLPSLARQLSSPTLRDTGLREQAYILDSILARGEEPVVLDARELLLDPPGVLRQACAGLGIPFEDAMLSWPAGPKPEDGVWAKHWYHNVHASTGFAPYSPPQNPFPAPLEPLLEECLPYYERLRNYAIGARVVRSGDG